MCGIAGAHGGDCDVEGALDAIAHRGPDGRGIADFADARLGHVRLAIQDPHPRSDQPFVYGDVTLTYVGEIWNADTLRGFLRRNFDAEFQTTGDTEVVAAILHHLGPERGVHSLDGMFALAWADLAGVHLARDRFGKVPLYWVTDGEGGLLPRVRWSSERRAFGVPEAYVAEPVPAGALLSLSTGSALQLDPYYRLLPRRPSRARTGALPGYVQDRLREAVRRRLVSDVPVAFLSSGGLDSSIILALVKEVREDVVAYTAVGDPRSPDLEAAREVCEHLGVELREVDVPEADAAAVMESVDAIEFPMKAQVEIAWPCLQLAERISADGFKVVLSGEGADEVFGGYGNLARQSSGDAQWKAARLASVEKMARGNFPRTNKVFMRHGVEARLPFLERELVEAALSLGVRECPPGKVLLKDAARGLVPDSIIRRQKETFKGASGVSGAFSVATDGEPLKAYNAAARSLFGGVTVG